MKGLYNPTPVDALPVNAALAKAISSDWAFDHAADIDAHMVDMFQVQLVGYSLLPFPVYSSIDHPLVANTIYACPFYVVRNMTIDRLTIEVAIAGAAGTVARLGAYNDTGACYPNALQIDGNTVSVATTGLKAATISTSLTKGLHWLVVVSNGAPTVRGFFPAWSCLGLSTGGVHITTIQAGYSAASIDVGALANPFAAGASLVANRIPTPVPRLLTLD